MMLATIRYDTWNVLNKQHIIPNLIRWDYSDIPGGGHKYTIGPTYMVEGGHHLRNPHVSVEEWHKMWRHISAFHFLLWVTFSSDLKKTFMFRSSEKLYTERVNMMLSSYYSVLIWVRWWRHGCLVTLFCYQLITKPGNKRAAPPWPNPYYVTFLHKVIKVHGPTTLLDDSVWRPHFVHLYAGQIEKYTTS